MTRGFETAFRLLFLMRFFFYVIIFICLRFLRFDIYLKKQQIIIITELKG